MKPKYTKRRTVNGRRQVYNSSNSTWVMYDDTMMNLALYMALTEIIVGDVDTVYLPVGRVFVHYFC